MLIYVDIHVLEYQMIVGVWERGGRGGWGRRGRRRRRDFVICILYTTDAGDEM